MQLHRKGGKARFPRLLRISRRSMVLDPNRYGDQVLRVRHETASRAQRARQSNRNDSCKLGLIFLAGHAAALTASDPMPKMPQRKRGSSFICVVNRNRCQLPIPYRGNWPHFIAEPVSLSEAKTDVLGRVFADLGYVAQDVTFKPGIVKRSVDPCPYSDSAQILPPLRVTIFWQIAKPRPLPGCSDPERRLNGAKIVSK